MVVATPYADHFRANIVRATHHALQRVEGAGRGMAEEARQFALNTLSYALELPEAWPAVSRLLLALAPRMEQAAHRDEWLTFLERGLAQGERLGDEAACAELAYHVGAIYFHQGRLAEARTRYAQGLDHYRRVGAAAREGRALNRLGTVAYTEGKLDEAIGHATAALALVADDPEEAGSSHKVLGTVAYRRQQWALSIEHFERSLAHWEQSGQKRLIAHGLTNLGTGLWGVPRWDEAAAVYRRAIALFDEVGDPLHRAVARMNLGNIYLKRESYEEAISIFLEVERPLREIGDPQRLAPLYNNLGFCYERLGQWAEGRRMYELSLKYWRQVGDAASIVNTLDNLAILQLASGDADGARASCEEARRWLEEIDEVARAPLEAMIEETMRRIGQAGE